MLDRLNAVAPDPILGIIAAHAADPSPRKIDLGIGVYRDETGNTPILDSVRKAERILLDTETSKSYLGPRGVPGFNSAMQDLIFGNSSEPSQQGRVRTVQTPGGTGALRVGADLVKAAMPGAKVWASDPTWANHVPLLGNAGLKLETYPYYDGKARTVRFDAMLDALERAKPGDVVLLHGCCHNPTGADLSKEQWDLTVALMRRQQLIPFVDMAYLGFAEGIDADAYGARLVASELPEALIAVSCSKNFGLYRERVGALITVSAEPKAADATASHLARITRGLYSMPPDHGAAIVDRILADAELKALWLDEVGVMRERINHLRRRLVEALAAKCPQRDFSHIARQRGMFSFLGVTPDEVKRLREEFHVYMTDNSRVNIAGVSERNLDYLATAIAAVVG